jgi:hypothetical protein
VILLPIALAGLGCLAMNNPRRRRRSKRSNPAMPEGFDERGTRYKLKKNTETREWMLVAYVNGKRHEERTLYFEDREDAENTLKHIVSQGNTKQNPRRGKRRRRNPHDYALAQRLYKKHKSALTRAKNTGDPDKVIAAVKAFEADFENNNLPLPDSWSDWQRAADDAVMAKRYDNRMNRMNPRRRSKRRRR